MGPVPRTIDREQRKEQLAEALWRVAVERGIAAVSVRTVAEEAGVVVGSLRHVFASRADLLEFSAQLMVRRASERIQAVASPVDESDRRRYAVEVLRQLLPLTPDSRAELEVNVALIAEAPALPRLTEIRDHAHREIAVLCGRIVEMLAGDPDRPAAARLHALVDGLALHLLHAPRDDGAWAVDIVRGEVDRIAG